MGVWDTLKSWGNKAVDYAKGAYNVGKEAVKNIFTGSPTYTPVPKNEAKQSTLNEVATNTTTTNATQNIKNNVNNEINAQNKASEIIQPNSVPTSTPVTQKEDLFANAIVKNREDVDRQEREREEEGAWDTAKRRGNNIVDWFKSVPGKVSDWAEEYGANRQIDAEEKAERKRLAVGYDEDNKNVTYLDFKGQSGTSDWFNSSYDAHKRQFDELYAEYVNDIEGIQASNVDPLEKMLMMQSKKNEFFKNGKSLLGTYDDDYYTDVSWFALGSKGTTGKWYRPLVGRRYEDFTPEQLNELKGIDMSNGITDGMFENFLETYEYNENLAKMYKHVEVGDNMLDSLSELSLTEESITGIQQGDVNKIMNDAMGKISDIDKAELFSGDAKTLATQYTRGVVEDKVAQFYQWIEAPIALYSIVKSKPVGELTDGEKRILQYGPTLEKLKEDYMNALDKFVIASLDQGLVDGQIRQVADNIDGKTITDFFYDAIADDAFKIIGTQEGLAISAIDTLQLINNQFNYDYWKGKGNWLRQTWGEVQRGGGMAGFLVSEGGKATAAQVVQGIENMFGDDNQLSDYIRADFTSAMMMETESDSWVSWFGQDAARAIKQFSLMGLENAPELLAQVYAMNKLLPGGGAARGVKAAVDTQKKTSKLSSLLNYINKENKVIKGINSLTDKATGAASSVLETTKSLTGWNKAKNGISSAIQGIGNSKGYQTIKGWIGDVVDATTPKSLTGKATLDFGGKLLKGVVSDQAVDALASYYDTEAYSTPTFYLSTGMTAATELVGPLIGTAQLWKRFANILKGDNQGLGTIWRFTSLMKDDDYIKAISQRLGGNITYDGLKQVASEFADVERAMKLAYNELNAGGKQAVNTFSKQVLKEQLSRLKTIDWNSEYGKRLNALLNNEKSNAADVLKYTLGLNGKVEFGPFVSTIVFKNADGQQTRFLKRGYDISLDNVEGGFRRKLSDGFSKEDIKTISEKTKYGDAIKDGKPNESYFFYDDKTNKYFLNSEGAKKLGLDVSGYTNSMKKYDEMVMKTGKSKEFLEDVGKRLGENKGISGELIDELATSGTFDKIVESIKKITCD